VVNVGQGNRDILIDLLRKQLEEYIATIPKMMVHNFSKAKPFYAAEIKVTAAEFEVEVLKREVEVLKKKLQRAQRDAAIICPQNENLPSQSMQLPPPIRFGPG
jgi:hypothetical protein